MYLISSSRTEVTSGGSLSSEALRSKWCAPFGIISATRVSEMVSSTPPPCQGSNNPLLKNKTVYIEWNAYYNQTWTRCCCALRCPFHHRKSLWYEVETPHHIATDSQHCMQQGSMGLAETCLSLHQNTLAWPSLYMPFVVVNKMRSHYNGYDLEVPESPTPPHQDWQWHHPSHYTLLVQYSCSRH